MVAKTKTFSFSGIEANPVDVQVKISSGNSVFSIVGLPDKSVGESKERVRGAITSTGLSWPFEKITVNLAPADLQKEGGHFDLAIAIGRKGQNARLTSRLVGWRLDIEEFKAVGADPEGDAKRKLVAALGIADPLALRLVKAGFVSLELFDGVETADLEGVGFTPEESVDIISRVSARSH